MRALTFAQKTLLNKTMLENEPTPNEKSMFGNENVIRGYENLPDEVWNKLVEMNDTEILHQEVNRFISDWRMSRLK